MEICVSNTNGNLGQQRELRKHVKLVREVMIIETRKRISTGNERRNIMGVPYTRPFENSPYGVRH